jgi:GNAT superfamily N-acetyltransferase
VVKELSPALSSPDLIPPDLLPPEILPQGVGRIVPAHDYSVDAITRFIHSYWPKGVALSDPGFYHWYSHPPAANGTDQSLLVVDDANQIVGYLGVSATQFCHATTPALDAPAATTTTLFLHPALRGGLLAWQLLQHVQQHYAVALGMNLNPTSQAIQRRLGYKCLSGVERMVRLYDWPALAPALTPHMPELTPAGKNLLAMQRPVKQGPVKSPTLTSPDWIVPTQEQLAHLLTDYRWPHQHHLARNWAWCEWRYVQHPCYTYTWLWLYPEDATRSAVLVLRQETHTSPANPTEGATFTIAHVVDVLPLTPDIPAMAQALGPVLDAWAQQQQVAMVDVMTTLPALTAPLWQAGWLSTLHEGDLPLPHLFNPIELRSPATGNVAIWAKDPTLTLANTSQFYLSKADGDWDRPTSIQ